MPTQEFVGAVGRLAGNHLWQSTGFAAVAVLLALALRANHARVRYWLWMAASVKFLVPFSVLAAVGSYLGRWLVPATPVARLPLVVGQIVQPFAPVQGGVLRVAPSVPALGFAQLLPGLLLAIWFCGFAVVVVYGWTRWRRVAAVVRASAPLREGREAEALRRAVVGQAGSLRRVGNPPQRRLPTGAQLAKLPHIDLVSSTARLEPGIFGIFRPVLWLPAGIGERLGDAELEAILAHELCHARRRDNLAAAVHMAVEAVFWFHPLVWWLGARLVEERERACDEEVVRLGGEPQIYAESILKVCEFYLASPVRCVAGVTGGELKKRIEGIMTNRFMRRLSFGKRLMLGALVAVAMAWPIAIGVVNAQAGRPQAQTGTPAPAAFEVASIKPVDPNVPHKVGLTIYPGGRVVIPTTTLKSLTATAFGLSYWQVSGGDAWTEKNEYDVEAKPPENLRSSIKDLRYTWFGIEDEHLRQMLQVLLIDRFELKFHRETKMGNVCLLERSGKSLRLKPSGTSSVGPSPPDGAGLFACIGYANGRWVISATSAPQLAKFASDYYLHTPVLDRTELSGSFDYKQPVPDEDPHYGDNTDSFLRLIPELGLKLERTKGPVETFVIDHAALPSPN
ncbi:MAG: M56 family metallopeptidase [Bryobacteraceae bacterium]|jgi:uncharacterized protein (TIGR03435 family)